MKLGNRIITIATFTAIKAGLFKLKKKKNITLIPVPKDFWKQDPGGNALAGANTPPSISSDS